MNVSQAKYPRTRRRRESLCLSKTFVRPLNVLRESVLPFGYERATSRSLTSGIETTNRLSTRLHSLVPEIKSEHANYRFFGALLFYRFIIVVVCKRAVIALQRRRSKYYTGAGASERITHVRVRTQKR